MSAHRSPAAQIVADLCARFPKASSRTLAKRLHNEHPALFTSIELARNSVRTKRGNRGKRARGEVADKSLFKPNGKAGELPPLPESIATSWEPFVIDARRVLVLSDLHLPFHSQKALDAALEHGDEFRPEAVLFNGDVFDFFQLSRFDKHPKICDVDAELAAGRQLFTHVRKRFPKARIFAKLGNHDERWANYIYRAAPLLSGVKQVVDGWQAPAGIIENKVTVIKDQRPIMLGKLPVFHGHELGKSIFSPVNPARGAFMRAHHTILIGHSHQTSGHADTNMWHDETFCWSTGCLCALSPEYARINRWNWGFATVTVERDGAFNVQNMRIAKNGKVRAS